MKKENGNKKHSILELLLKKLNLTKEDVKNLVTSEKYDKISSQIFSNNYDALLEHNGHKLFVEELFKEYHDIFIGFYSLINKINIDILNVINKKSKEFNNDIKFICIAKIAQRCFLIIKEIKCLIENGYPSGAFGRWRTLYEFNIIAEFIINSEDDVAEKYKKSLEAQALKEFTKNNYSQFYNKEENNKIKEKEEEIQTQYGKNFFQDYGWSGENSFTDLMELSNNEFMKQNYRESCQYIHGSSISLINNIGSNDKINTLDCETNIGFYKPICLTMLSLLKLYEIMSYFDANEETIIKIIIFEKIIEKINKDLDEKETEIKSKIK